VGRVNKEWHEQNKMPAKATDDQRINWHLAHIKNCLCMPIPKGVLEKMREKNIPIPE
jgi:hypothetical protein